ncbi:MAG TPA: uracil-DNA glycosylase family protein, partial [Phycisphaerales bacterium]|nr:uracil-DNA glycosylase family protein [Phycisphaerales bacterium]
KFTARGKRRMHSKPSARETDACRPWLEREIELVAPRLIVALGATAARSLLGPAFRVTKRRGELITGTRWGAGVIATVHPSSILRAPGDEERRAAFAAFVRDLAAAATHLKSGATSKAGVPAGRAAGGRAAGEPRRAPRRTAGGSRAGAVSDGAAAAPRGAGSAPPVRRPSR